MSFRSSQEFENVPSPGLGPIHQELSLSRRSSQDMIEDPPLLSLGVSDSLMVATDSQAMDYPPRQRNHQPVVRPRARLPRRSSSLLAGRSNTMTGLTYSEADVWEERRLHSLLKTVKANLSSLPAKLERITEEALEPMKKVSRDAVSLTEELRTVREMMEKVFRSQEEDAAKYKKLFEDLMTKHKSLLEDLKTDAKDHEDKEKSLSLLEELVMRQSKKMEELRFKLSVKMMGGETKVREQLKEEALSQSLTPSPMSCSSDVVEPEGSEQQLKEEEVSQSLTASQMSVFGDEEEAEQGEMTDGVSQTVSDSQNSLYSDDEDGNEEERRSWIEKDYPITISSDSESSTDSESCSESELNSSLAMIEE